jgi:hypothetical protein
MLFIYFLFVCDNITPQNIILSVGDVNNNIGTHVNTNVNLNVNDERSGSSIAVTGAMVGVGAAVGKAIAKSPMPPLQKAGAIVGASVLGGVGQALIAGLSGNIGVGGASSNTNNGVNKFLGSSHVSILENSLSLQEVIYFTCIYMILLLIILLVFKLHFNNYINLNLSKTLGNNTNSKIEYYLNKIIKLNKQMSVFWI